MWTQKIHQLITNVWKAIKTCSPAYFPLPFIGSFLDIALHSFTSFSFPVCPSDPYYNKLSRYGHYQNPTNPSTFYQCAKGYNEPFTMPCPAYPNTAFNPFKDQCDYKCPESKELAEELKDCFPVTDNTEAKIVALTGRSIWKWWLFWRHKMHLSELVIIGTSEVYSTNPMYC